MTSYWVWITARDCSERRLLSFLRVISLIELVINNSATRTIEFNGSDSLAKYSLATGSDLVLNSYDFMILVNSLEQRKGSFSF